MKKQLGFAHAVLIIGLVVAFMGALGFIFWQNFIHEEPKQTELVKVAVKGQEKQSIESMDSSQGYTVLADWNARFPNGSQEYQLTKGRPDSPDDTSEYYRITSDEVKKACDSNEVSIGAITRYEVDAKIDGGWHNGMTAKEAFADSDAKVVTPKYIYVFMGPQSACSEDDQVNQLLSEKLAQLSTQFKKLEEY